ncbi:MAG: radical SAM protein, partial [Deltaproteobacteria bacterium]|nr:radical SAM protein [Deltaproteobacteria bacterium]
DRKTLTCAGVGGQRRRSVDTLCDEMAPLWHEQGVRYFYFVDEHLLPRKQQAALELLEAWKRGLGRRGVGPLGIGCMLRAEWVTEPVLNAFAEVGLVRTFLGVELASDEEHRKFGRGGKLDRGLEVLDDLAGLGVAASCNLMVVHPYSTRASIAAGIDTLRSMKAHGVEATQMQIYFGTKLHEQMAREGRVTGNPLQYGYRYADRVVERFAAAFTRLRFDAFGDYSLTCRQHDAALAISLAQRLYPRAPLADLSSRLEALSGASNGLRIASYAEALDLAERTPRGRAVEALVGRAHAQAAAIATELTAVYDEVSRRVAQPARSFAPMRSAAVSLLGVCLASASLAACQGPTPAAPPPTANLDGAATTAGEPGPAPSATAAEPDGAASASATTTPPLLTSQPTSSPGCSEARQDELRDKVAKITDRVDTCASRTVLFGWGFKDGPISIRSRDGSEQRNAANDERIKQALVQELSPAERECLIQQAVFVPRNGQQHAQRDRLQETFEKACTRGRRGPAVLVEVDGQGKVVDVRAGNPSTKLSPQIRACVVRALKGLTFPCLAGEEVTRYDPHPVIME